MWVCVVFCLCGLTSVWAFVIVSKKVRPAALLASFTNWDCFEKNHAFRYGWSDLSRLNRGPINIPLWNTMMCKQKTQIKVSLSFVSWPTGSKRKKTKTERVVE